MTDSKDDATTPTRIRWGVFGGSFDPLHVGHLVLAEQARERHGLQRVLFMLTPDPPHKVDWKLTPFEQRLEMLQAALADGPAAFEVNTIENERAGPHYTVETMPLLRARYPQVDDWFLLIGGDSAEHLARWHRSRELVQLARICVVVRPGSNPDALLPALTAPATDGDPLCSEASARLIIADAVTDSPPIGISSTDLRDRIREGRSTRYLMPTATREVIDRLGLYRNGNH